MFGGSNQVDPTRVAAYIRWSTEEQGSGTTLAVQRERVGLFIRSQGWQLHDDLIFIDDGYSGASLQRPAMDQLRQAVLAARVSCVVVYKLDRLSRSLLDTVTLVRQEWRGKAVLCSATEHFDTESPVGQMVFNILISFAEFERNLIRERTLAGKRKRAEQGRNAGQKYPFGYIKGEHGGWQVDRIDGPTGQLAGPAAVVRHIFDAYLAGQAMATIAAKLNGDGVATPEGRRWRSSYIGRVLGNALYAGIYRYGRKGTAERRESIGGIPHIVTPEVFERVQRQRGDRRGRPSGRSPEPYLLTGTLRCGLCGGPMAGSRGKGVRYYVCTNRTYDAGCTNGYVPAARVDQMAKQVARIVCEREGVTASAVSWHDWEVAAREAQRTARAALQRAERRAHRLQTQLLDGTLEGGSYEALGQRVEGERREALAAIERAEALQQATARVAAPGAQTAAWEELTPDDWRQLVREAFASMAGHRPRSEPAAPIRLLLQPYTASDRGGELQGASAEGLVWQSAPAVYDRNAIERLGRLYSDIVRDAVMRRESVLPGPPNRTGSRQALLHLDGPVSPD